MRVKYFIVPIVMLMLAGCASPYVVPQNINGLSQRLSHEKAVAILSQNLKLTKSSNGYGLCMGSDTPGANWLMAQTTKHNFKIDRKKAQFSALEQGQSKSTMVRTGIGVAVGTSRARNRNTKSLIFNDIDKIQISEVSWGHVCGHGHDSGFMINLFEGEGKVSIVVIKENKFDEFMAAILKLNSNSQLKIYK